MSTSSAKQIGSSEYRLPQPVYVLRGHASAVHALFFSESNLEFFSGDADGWMVIWSMTTKRALAVWKAHEATILGTQAWGDHRLITHGRDGRLRVWGIHDLTSGNYSTVLPVENSTEVRRQPWLFHSMEVSSLTFCSFAACTKAAQAPFSATQTPTQDQPLLDEDTTPNSQDLLVAIPGTKDSSIELFQLPSEKQIAMIPAPDQANGKTGMVMALRVLYHSGEHLLIIAGYESGRTIVFKHVVQAGQWQAIYTSRPHSQPILSLDVASTRDSFFTSGADAIIAKHPISLRNTDSTPLKEIQTRHSGQQGLQIRSDGRIFATAGWDARGRVYSAKTMKELAVLKWAKDGCYALAFGAVHSHLENLDPSTSSKELVAGRLGLADGSLLGQSREQKAKFTHWLALGSKDGKISLWDIY